MMEVGGVGQAREQHSEAVADELLRVVADRIRGALRESDLVARGAGDQLAAMLVGVERMTDAVEVLQRRQDGETILPREGTPEELLPVLEVLSPGEIEASVQAAVGLVCECHWQAGQEIMLLTSEEAEQVRARRREKAS